MRNLFELISRKRAVLALALSTGFILAVLLLPSNPVMPVRGATLADWNHETFWYEPWGRSGVHKGIDIFAQHGTDVVSATGGVVMYAGEIELGGRVILILGPKWRVHYYAHLSATSVSGGQLVAKGEKVGAVGTTGNAAGKPPHLHYSIVTMLPYPWRATGETQGWKKIFFLDPTVQLMKGI